MIYPSKHLIAITLLVVAAVAILGTSAAFAQTGTTTGPGTTGAGTVITPGTTGSGTTGAGTTGTGTFVTPGVPNTGLGGDALVNLFTLVGSGLAASVGAAYLARQYVRS